jgi:hypothetical protein
MSIALCPLISANAGTMMITRDDILAIFLGYSILKKMTI